jgi:hypothetical protein
MSILSEDLDVRLWQDDLVDEFTSFVIDQQDDRYKTIKRLIEEHLEPTSRHPFIYNDDKVATLCLGSYVGGSVPWAIYITGPSINARNKCLWRWDNLQKAKDRGYWRGIGYQTRTMKVGYCNRTIPGWIRCYDVPMSLYVTLIKNLRWADNQDVLNKRNYTFQRWEKFDFRALL